ncbi:hypothetical protein O162_14720 [Pseudomonas putida SJ3]|uniref:Uncharacterized protein n=1 Tax=Pseudomonas putida TaxID=303 RepID=A0A2S3WK64_PSEPU|nr:hypothetical protein O162_14720 [Pseudomonas putida SJ3]POF99597.1 hypothetical protein BGP82_27515 [Pseudomonas putida]
MPSALGRLDRQLSPGMIRHMYRSNSGAVKAAPLWGGDQIIPLLIRELRIEVRDRLVRPRDAAMSPER